MKHYRVNKPYAAPELTELGTIAEVTSAIGAASHEDQSEFPEQFPPDHGSHDVCHNDDPNDMC